MILLYEVYKINSEWGCHVCPSLHMFHLRNYYTDSYPEPR
jgi:hypothetical protein